MDQGNHSSAIPQMLGSPTESDMPPGDHPLEVAARKGMGPLSPLARNAWHGLATPCVSCGQLVRREDASCEHCGQDLSQRMLTKMRSHAGPWYVFEHVRPFPGVSFQRLVRQIRRGVLTETSIIRGPATDHQWRFAVETPGVCLYFGKCWHCHGDAASSATRCPHCGANLLWDKTARASGTLAKTPASPLVTRSVTLVEPPRVIPSLASTSPTIPQTPTPYEIAPTEETPATTSIDDASPEWMALRAAVEAAHISTPDRMPDSDQKTGRSVFTWIGVVLSGIVFIALLTTAQCRERHLNPSQPPAAKVGS